MVSGSAMACRTAQSADLASATGTSSCPGLAPDAHYRYKAPLTAAEAATIILDGVRSGGLADPRRRGREMLDAAVRAKPEAAYDYAELFRARAGQKSRRQE